MFCRLLTCCGISQTRQQPPCRRKKRITFSQRSLGDRQTRRPAFIGYTGIWEHRVTGKNSLVELFLRVIPDDLSYCRPLVAKERHRVRMPAQDPL
jgi:hypothetical protein